MMFFLLALFRSKSPVLSGFFIFFACFFMTGCFWGSSRLASKTVLQVNDQALSVKDFSELLADQLKAFDALAAKDPNNVRRAKEEVIRGFILRSLTADFAKANQLLVSDQEVEKEINVIRASYPDDLSFRRVLAEENVSFSDWKENLRKSLIEQKVFKKLSENLPAPTAEEVKKYYEEKKERYKRKERIYLRQIIVDNLTKAKSIHEEIRKFDFSELAKKFSVSPEGKFGGLVGWVEKGSVDIFDKAFLLPVGGVSQVLESSYGFHIFKVERKAGPGYASIEEVREEIVRTLSANKQQAEFIGWLDKQIRSARVLRDNKLLDSITVETRGQK